MKEKHISLAEFVRIFTTTRGPGIRGERASTRAARFAEAICQPEVVDAVADHCPANMAAVGFHHVKTLRREMKILEEAGEMFGAYDEVARRSNDGDDGHESYRTVLGRMKFDEMAIQVATLAPSLSQLLDSLMAPKRIREDRVYDHTKIDHRRAIIASVLSYSRAAKGSNTFPRLFGAFLHSNGVKRRVLDLLHHFGLSEGYKGVHKHLGVVATQAKVRVALKMPLYGCN